jgi:protein tyrosine phosphatase
MLTYSLVAPFDKQAKEVDKVLEELEKNKLFIELERDIEEVETKCNSYYPEESKEEVLRAPLMGLFGKNKKLNQQMLVVQYENSISFLHSEIDRLTQAIQSIQIRNQLYPVDKQQAEVAELEKELADNKVLLKQHEEEKKLEEARLEEISPSYAKIMEESYISEMFRL